MYSGGEFPRLKTTVFDHFWTVLGAYKRHTPLHIGLLSPQICTDLRGVKSPWKIGGNPPIGGKEYSLPTKILIFSSLNFGEVQTNRQRATHNYEPNMQIPQVGSKRGPASSLKEGNFMAC